MSRELTPQENWILEDLKELREKYLAAENNYHEGKKYADALRYKERVIVLDIIKASIIRGVKASGQ